MSTNLTGIIRGIGSTAGYDSSIVQDVMLRSVEKYFGDKLPDTAVQWLADNGPGPFASKTTPFHFGLKCDPQTTAAIYIKSDAAFSGKRSRGRRML